MEKQTEIKQLQNSESIIGVVPNNGEVVHGTHQGTQVELTRGNFDKNDVVTDALTVSIEGYPRLRLHALGQAVLRYGNAISTTIRLKDKNHKDRIVFPVAGIPSPDPESCL